MEVDGKRFDGVAVTLDCAEEQAAAIVDVVRSKMGQQGLRLYRKTGSQWKRV